jgi:hypothetical protein
MKTSQQLERELNELWARFDTQMQQAEDEVEFWKAKAYEAEASEGKHEAEVERLREELAKSENEAKSLRKEWRNSFLLEVAMPRWEIKKSDFDGKPYLWDNLRDDNYDLDTLCRILNEYEVRLENARIILNHE